MNQTLATSLILLLLLSFGTSYAQTENTDKFKQLYEELPSPNSYRNAAGAPGHEYWQQKADYKMSIDLNNDKHTIHGSETIVYTNNSPDNLSYLWLQLDQNIRAKSSDSYKIKKQEMPTKMDFNFIKQLNPSFDGGFKITKVTDEFDKVLSYTIVKTMMRIDLEKPLKSDEKISFNIDWWYNINDRAKIRGRSGYEHFKKENNNLYIIAQFFPRMCVYNDIDGWQNKQFLGRGEFTLVFGDYNVDITVPNHYKVAATGQLQNPNEVLSNKEQKRLQSAAKSFDKPIMIVTPKEALKNEKRTMSGTKTWSFHAKNVRDFAFSASNKFIWDAMNVKFDDGSTSMAMSMYSKEGNPLWEQYSTKVIAHTLKWYSHYTINYPYPVAWSIHANNIGMEYPMICFNGGRPESDGTYSSRKKYGMIGVITHEVGHNFFPMIVNSDERQWTWMDEGLNTFVQHLTHEEWEKNYKGWYSTPESMLDYMGGDKTNIRPIMSNSESLYQFGYNAYGKPTAALNILRETIMGREVFDFAFKTYCQRWAFKQPSPSDFFRTMEDASSIDLDWFWRGWFYTTDHVDIAINNVKEYSINNKNPTEDMKYLKKERSNEPIYLGRMINNNSTIKKLMDLDPHIKDFYTDYEPLNDKIMSKKQYKKYIESLTESERMFLEKKYLFYQINFENRGGLVMPIILKFIYHDNSSEIIRIPAEIWIKNNKEVSKVFRTSKQIKEVILDPFLETADVDKSNNYYPPRIIKDRYELFKEKKKKKKKNPMQK